MAEKPAARMPRSKPASPYEPGAAVQATAAKADDAPKAKPSKLQFDAPEDVAGRIKAAWYYTPIDDKEPSIGKFYLDAVMAEVERREAANNGGKAYEPLRTKLTPGRRIG